MSESEILEDIRERVGKDNLFSGNSFRRGRCSVNLTGVSEGDRVVVDLDTVFPSGQTGRNQCECILFYFEAAANFVVIPIELKGGEVDASEASNQLKGGAAFAADYVPSGSKNVCHPILFHNGISRAEVRQLKSSGSKVHFRGKSFEIKTARCGQKLTDVLS